MYLLMAGLIPAIVIQYRSLALVKVLSDNNQNQAQFNTVFSQNDKNGPDGGS
jgi:hypothetical protein